MVKMIFGLMYPCVNGDKNRVPKNQNRAHWHSRTNNCFLTCGFTRTFMWNLFILHANASSRDRDVMKYSSLFIQAWSVNTVQRFHNYNHSSLEHLIRLGRGQILRILGLEQRHTWSVLKVKFKEALIAQMGSDQNRAVLFDQFLSSIVPAFTDWNIK